MTPQRERLPNRGRSGTFEIVADGLTYRATRFAGGRLAEIFISNHKTGSDADTAAKDSGVVCSIALQHGVPLKTIRRALLREGSGKASGPLATALDFLAGGESV
jgi:hypothetical protein